MPKKRPEPEPPELPTGEELDEALVEHIEALSQFAAIVRPSRRDVANARTIVRQVSHVSIAMAQLAFEIIDNDGERCECPVCRMAIEKTEDMIERATGQGALLDGISLKQRDVFVAIGLHTTLAANVRSEIDFIFSVIKAAHLGYEHVKQNNLRRARDAGTSLEWDLVDSPNDDPNNPKNWPN